MRKRLIIIIFICACILTVTGVIWLYRKAVLARDEGEKDGRFDLYIYTTAPDNTLIPYPLTVNNQVIPDQPPRIFFESLKNAWLYLLLFNPENEMTVLFPGPGGNFPGDYQCKRFFLPEDNNWKPYLKTPGQYTLYFVISTTPLKVVERLLHRYAECRKAGKPAGNQGEITAHLKAEIEKYKREEEWIKNTGAIPEWIDGTVRGHEEEVIYRAWSVPFRGIITHSLLLQHNPGDDDE